MALIVTPDDPCSSDTGPPSSGICRHSGVKLVSHLFLGEEGRCLKALVLYPSTWLLLLWSRVQGTSFFKVCGEKHRPPSTWSLHESLGLRTQILLPLSSQLQAPWEFLRTKEQDMVQKQHQLVLGLMWAVRGHSSIKYHPIGVSVIFKIFYIHIAQHGSH